jgi:hypothetical protein
MNGRRFPKIVFENRLGAAAAATTTKESSLNLQTLQRHQRACNKLEFILRLFAPRLKRTMVSRGAPQSVGRFEDGAMLAAHKTAPQDSPGCKRRLPTHFIKHP